MDYVECLNLYGYLGRRDWRMPDLREMASMVNYGRSESAAWLNAEGFTDVRAGVYWSSDIYVPTSWNAWGVNLYDGAAQPIAMRHRIHIWPVSGGR